MRNGLKEKIKSAYESETPNLRESVIATCERETQEPAPLQSEKARRELPVFFKGAIAAAACAAVFAAGLFVGTAIPERQPEIFAQTCVYLDVNPSLSLSLDGENRVLDCSAENEDAETVLDGMELAGVPLKTALHAIVGSMYVKGYLTDEENSVLISVDSEKENGASAFLSYITDEVNAVFEASEMECSIIAQGVDASEDLKRRAEEQGVSVGKMHLVEKMIGSINELSESDVNELAEMSIRDLRLIYAEKPDGNEKPENEIFSGEISVKVEKDQVKSTVLTALGIAEEQLREYRISILPSRHGNMGIVYAVTVRLADGTTYKYEIDFESGEVLSRETVDGAENSGDEAGKNPDGNNDPNYGGGEKPQEQPENEETKPSHGDAEHRP